MRLAGPGFESSERRVRMSGLKRGDHVEWHTPQGPIRGTVVRSVTAHTHLKGWTAEASAAGPEVEVRRDKSGARAVHRARALRKVR
jgi:hypothetical protein